MNQPYCFETNAEIGASFVLSFNILKTYSHSFKLIWKSGKLGRLEHQSRVSCLEGENCWTMQELGSRGVQDNYHAIFG